MFGKKYMYHISFSIKLLQITGHFNLESSHKISNAEEYNTTMQNILIHLKEVINSNLVENDIHVMSINLLNP